jgi:fucose permease
VLDVYIVNTFKSIGETIPELDDDHYLSTVSSISALFNAARFVWSGALDKFAFKKVYGVLLVIQITLAFTIELTQKSKVSFAMTLCLALFCIGGHFALFPNVLKQVFGK